MFDEDVFVVFVGEEGILPLLLPLPRATTHPVLPPPPTRPQLLQPSLHQEPNPR